MLKSKLYFGDSKRERARDPKVGRETLSKYQKYLSFENKKNGKNETNLRFVWIWKGDIFLELSNY